MDTLHSVIRNIKGETKSARRDHLSVVRDFISQLDRIGKRQGGEEEPKAIHAKVMIRNKEPRLAPCC